MNGTADGPVRRTNSNDKSGKKESSEKNEGEWQTPKKATKKTPQQEVSRHPIKTLGLHSSFFNAFCFDFGVPFEFHVLSTGFTGFLLCFTGFYCVLLCFTGFY